MGEGNGTTTTTTTTTNNEESSKVTNLPMTEVNDVEMANGVHNGSSTKISSFKTPSHKVNGNSSHSISRSIFNTPIKSPKSTHSIEIADEILDNSIYRPFARARYIL